jgi:hypothetical protein
MIFYRCDNCQLEETGIAPVQLKGDPTFRGGGLHLSDLVYAVEFCSPKCFWGWVEKNVEKKRSALCN